MTLNASKLEISRNFQVEMLGTPRQIEAAMRLMERPVEIELQGCRGELGETGRSMVAQVERYIDDGFLPEYPPGECMFAQLTERHTADTEQTRESRMHSVLEAGLEALEAAKGPGLNLLNIAGRTGLIVALTIVLRQVVGFHVAQALREGDSPEASRAWAVVAQTMIGPALILVGAIRNECAGTASPGARLGRICMASITMGALIAAYLTGASKNLLPTVTGVTIYTLARGLANAFFPLKDNAGGVTAVATGVRTAAYGAAQFLLDELATLAPLSGPARAAAELGYSVGADAIQGALNAFGIVVDDTISILCKSWNLLTPSVGLDSVFSDPESLQQIVLEVRAGVQLPTRTQLADALLDIGALRLSAGHAISLVVGTVALLLSEAEVGEGERGHILSGCLAIMLMMVYLPLIFGSVQRSGNSYSPQETVVP
ncbi:hypothetical protein [Pseudomonas sp. NPDC086251]|uniref:hypothetical protein n=1 Tax=Pseudomonas sp. NPDC086251 TaxID=3364431 RepID=UPI0038377B1D